MKKLMIAAAIVCAAVMGHAAQVNWDVDWAYSNDGNGINTFADPGVMTYWIVNMGSSTDTSGLSVNADGELVNTSGYSVLDEMGTIEMTGNGTTPEGSVANGNYLAMVIYDAANKLYGVSDAVAVTGIVADPPTAGALVDRVFQNDGGNNEDATPYMVANMAIAADIPEPTSGLLLVLGMAGLALRRKQA